MTIFQTELTAFGFRNAHWTARFNWIANQFGNFTDTFPSESASAIYWNCLQNFNLFKYFFGGVFSSFFLYQYPSPAAAVMTPTPTTTPSANFELSPAGIFQSSEMY